MYGAIRCWRKQIGRRDLGAGVERREIPSEPADHPEPLTPAVRFDACRLSGPRERELGRDPALAGQFNERDELGEKPPVGLELEPKLATDRQVVIERLAQPGHDRSPRPRQRERTERVSVHPRVVRGRDEMAMAEHLRDLLKRRSRAEHLRGGRVPQPVRPDLRHASPPARATHDRRHPAAADRPERRQHQQEQHAMLAARTHTQIRDDPSPTSTGNGIASCR